MAYTKQTWTNGPAGGTPVSAARLAHMETQYDEAVAGQPIIAPAPTGVAGTDQANLDAAVAQAQTTGGTLLLQAGTYNATITTAQSFSQPRILGRGKTYTTVKSIKIKGGSGTLSGGLIADLTISNPGGTALELADCGGVVVRHVQFTNSAVGLRFHNESVGGFTEFCVAEDCDFDQSVTLPVEYAKTAGNESFHGSGLRGSTVINQSASATGPVIKINAGCAPYNAPLTATIFGRNAARPFILNQSIRTPAFYGNLAVEQQSANNCVAVDTASASVVLLAGTFTALGGTGLKMGKLRLADRTYHSDTGYLYALRPFSVQLTSIGATKVVLCEVGTFGQLVAVDLIGNNYHYAYLLYVWGSPYNAGGVVTILATPLILNTAGWGAPTFAVENENQLTMVNAAYPAGAVAAQVAWSGPNYSAMV